MLQRPETRTLSPCYYIKTAKSLQHTTPHSNTEHTLQRIAPHTIASHIGGIAEPLQHATAHCNTEHTLQRTASPCILQRLPSHCNTLQHTATQNTRCNALHRLAYCRDSLVGLCMSIIHVGFCMFAAFYRRPTNSFCVQILSANCV